MNKKEQTVATYNATALSMAKKFHNLGARTSDISETFKLIDKKNPVVFEIGCGSGRDAAEICKYTKNYLGIDISEKFVEIARKEAPEGLFKVADVENYTFPQELDIIFAFASLLHVPKESLRKVLKQGYEALNTGGVIRISLKYSDTYQEVTKEDEFGIRTYFFYSQTDMRELLEKFTIIKNEINDLRGQKWLEILAKK